MRAAVFLGETLIPIGRNQIDFFKHCRLTYSPLLVVIRIAGRRYIFWSNRRVVIIRKVS